MNSVWSGPFYLKELELAQVELIGSDAKIQGKDMFSTWTKLDFDQRLPVDRFAENVLQLLHLTQSIRSPDGLFSCENGVCQILRIHARHPKKTKKLRAFQNHMLTKDSIAISKMGDTYIFLLPAVIFVKLLQKYVCEEIFHEADYVLVWFECPLVLESMAGERTPPSKRPRLAVDNETNTDVNHQVPHKTPGRESGRPIVTDKPQSKSTDDMNASNIEPGSANQITKSPPEKENMSVENRPKSNSTSAREVVENQRRRRTAPVLKRSEIKKRLNAMRGNLADPITIDDSEEEVIIYAKVKDVNKQLSSIHKRVNSFVPKRSIPAANHSKDPDEQRRCLDVPPQTAQQQPVRPKPAQSEQAMMAPKRRRTIPVAIPKLTYTSKATLENTDCFYELAAKIDWEDWVGEVSICPSLHPRLVSLDLTPGLEREPEGTLHLCTECGWLTTIWQLLWKHLQGHARKKQNLEDNFVQCDICRGHVLRASLQTHRYRHTGELPFRCRYCGFCYSDEKVLRKHEPTCSQQPFKCFKCKRSFLTSGDLTEHMTSLHIGDDHECPICHRFLTADVLEAHKKTHDVHVLFYCFECKKGFVDNRTLDKHIANSHGAEAIKLKVLPCKLCDVKMSNEAMYLRHVHYHTADHRCETCKLGFNTVAKMTSHNVMKHADLFKKYGCDGCDKRFGFLSLLEAHIFRQPECQAKIELTKKATTETVPMETASTSPQSAVTSGQNATCSTGTGDISAGDRAPTSQTDEAAVNANKSSENTEIPSSQATSAEKMELTVDENDNKQTCDAESAAEPPVVDADINSTRSRALPGPEECNVCPECGLAFRDRAMLKEHRLSHEGTKDAFPCEVCGKNLPNMPDYKKHIDVNHKADLPYACGLCEKRFKMRATVKIHVQAMHGKERFYCGLCEAHFITKFLMHQHALQCVPDVPDEDEDDGDDAGFERYLGPEWCKVCGRCCQTAELLENHMQFHDPLRDFECSSCCMRFSTKVNLSHHKSKHQKPTLQCGCCGRFFLRPLILSKHITTCLSAVGMMAPNTSQVKSKVKVNVKHNNNIIKRDVDKVEVVKKEKPVYPVPYDVEDDEVRYMLTKFICKLCGKYELGTEKLQRHVATFHDMDKRFECFVCQRRFAQSRELKIHLKSASHLDRDCRVCGKHYKSGMELHNHLMICKKTEQTSDDVTETRTSAMNTSIDETLEAVVQAAREGTLTSLTSTGEAARAMAKIPEREPSPAYEAPRCLSPSKQLCFDYLEQRRFVCDDCDTAFMSAYSLSRHIRAGCKYKIYKCMSCGKLCSDKAFFERHMATHAEKRIQRAQALKFPCPSCDRKFVSESSLAAHRRFQCHGFWLRCSSCQRRFTVRAALEAHLCRPAKGQESTDRPSPAKRPHADTDTNDANSAESEPGETVIAGIDVPDVDMPLEQLLPLATPCDVMIQEILRSDLPSSPAEGTTATCDASSPPRGVSRPAAQTPVKRTPHKRDICVFRPVFKRLSDVHEAKPRAALTSGDSPSRAHTASDDVIMSDEEDDDFNPGNHSFWGKLCLHVEMTSQEASTPLSNGLPAGGQAEVSEAQVSSPPRPLEAALSSSNSPTPSVSLEPTASAICVAERLGAPSPGDTPVNMSP